MTNEWEKKNDIFVKLPEDMDLEILSYLEEDDLECFIYTNKFLYDRLYIGKMRKLKLLNWHNILHFMVYDDFRSQVLRRVKNPSKQLTIDLPWIHGRGIAQALAETIPFLVSQQSATFVPSMNFPKPSLSLLSYDLSFPSISSLQLMFLSISDVLFHRYFLTAVTRLMSLRLYRDEDQPSFLPRVLSYLQTHSISLRLKELYLSRYQNQQLLPFIAGLQKVTLELMGDFTSFHEDYFLDRNKPALKTIVLNSCKVFKDLSMLGSVPNLVLRNCPKICNIDALQKNESVMIDCCDLVVDYWCSFREVKEVEISRPRSLPSFHQMQYTLITSLTLTDIDFQVQFPRAFPNTLKKFVVRYVSYFFPEMIETHSLEHIILESCYYCCRTIIGLSKIKRIELIDLYVRYIDCSSLNYSILIDNCKNVRNFSFLSHIDTVCLKKCVDVDLKQLTGIRNLSIINCSVVANTEVLNNIHTLSFYPLDISDKNFYHRLKKVANLETPFQPLFFKYWSLERFACQNIIVTRVEETEWLEILLFWDNEVNKKQKYYTMEYLRRLKRVKFTLKKNMK